ncbi:MAG: UvrD-helicase domain-containing protein [Candidatus Hydrogenedentota bacterium]
MPRLTPEQRRAIETTGQHLCVDAGAGSGKTSVLVNRIIHLLREGHARLDQIAAITFTDKAAAEMKSRVRTACRTLAARNDANAGFWRETERKVETARISTIHSFCMRLLREHALALNRDPDFGILAEAETYLLREDVIEDFLHNRLNAAQDGPLHRIAAAYGLNTAARELRALIGRRPAVEQALRRQPLTDVDALLAYWDETIETYRAEALHALREQPELGALRTELSELGEACLKPRDKRELMRQELLGLLKAIAEAESPRALDDIAQTLRDMKATGASKKNWASEDAYNRIKDIRDELRDLLDRHIIGEGGAELNRQAAEHTHTLLRAHEGVLGALLSAKGQRSAYDFDDLILDAVSIVRENRPIRERVAHGIRHLLIDEFQDTDHRQYELATLLAGAPDGPELFIVGDAKQSIYYFRGAEVDVFGRARDAAAETIRLDANFRTVPEILTWVNHFFSGSGLLRRVEPEYHPLDARRDAAGECRIECLIPPEPEEDEGEDAEERCRREAALLANRIARFCQGEHGARVRDEQTGELRPARYGDVALLFRALSNVKIYEQELRKAGLPYYVVSGRGFFERQEVRDLRNLLALVVDPWDEPALLAYLRSPIVGLTDNAIYRLGKGGQLAKTFHEAAMPPDFPEPDRLSGARELLDRLRQHAERPLPDVVRQALEESGLEAIVLAQFMGLQRYGNLRKVLELAEGFSRSQPARLWAFVHYLDETAASGVQEGEAAVPAAEGDAIALMSIHKAKGLEFPIAVVPGLTRDRGGSRGDLVRVHGEYGAACRVQNELGEWYDPPMWEIIKRVHDENEEAEEARLLYVALTRARDWLVLSGSPGKRTPRKSWFAKLDAQFSLRDRRHGETIRTDDWALRVIRQPKPLPPVETPDKPLPPLDKARMERRIQPVEPDAASAGRIAVSQLAALLAGNAEGSETPSGEFTMAQALAMERGQLVHGFFEAWDFETPPDEAVPDFLQRRCPAAGLRARLEQELPAMARQAAESPWGRRLREAQVEREAPFAWNLEGVSVTGTVDALLDGVTLLDYKTGVIPARLTAYEYQLLLYAAGCWWLRGACPETGVLAFVDQNEMREVSLGAERVSEAVEEARAVLSAGPRPQGVSIGETAGEAP